MPLNLRIIIITISILLAVLLLNLVRKGRISVKYSLIWFIAMIIIFIMGIMPSIVGVFANMIGFETASNMFFGIITGILILVCISLTIIVSRTKG